MQKRSVSQPGSAFKQELLETARRRLVRTANRGPFLSGEEVLAVVSESEGTSSAKGSELILKREGE